MSEDSKTKLLMRSQGSLSMKSLWLPALCLADSLGGVYKGIATSHGMHERPAENALAFLTQWRLGFKIQDQFTSVSERHLGGDNSNN